MKRKIIFHAIIAMLMAAPAVAQNLKEWQDPLVVEKNKEEGGATFYSADNEEKTINNIRSG